jgi:hypothetical protein
VRYNAFGFFEPVAGSLHFETVRDWNVWQIGKFKAHLDGGQASAAESDRDTADDAPLMREDDVVLHRGFKSTPLRTIDRGTLELRGHGEEIRFTGRRRGTSLTFSVRLIEGANIQNGEPLEFYFQGDMYRVTIPSPRGNTYKWLLAVEYLQGKAVLETTDASRQPV